MSRANPAQTKPIIGLSGGIGAGKSTVARILEALGAVVIDSDRLAHEALSEPPVVATVRRWWGESVFDPSGAVDRRAVAAIVFADAGERRRLERLLYPRIRRRREVLIARHNLDPDVKAVVLDSPKLFETGLDKRCNSVWFVEADWSLRAARVQASRGWTESELIRREKLLDPLDKKKAGTDHIIVNHLSTEALRRKLEPLFASVLASPARG